MKQEPDFLGEPETVVTPTEIDEGSEPEIFEPELDTQPVLLSERGRIAKICASFVCFLKFLWTSDVSKH